MFRDLYSKLAVLLLLLFCAAGALAIYSMDLMLPREQTVGSAVRLVVLSLAFSLAAALIIFGVYTRRLRRLATAVDRYVSSGFKAPIEGLSCSPEGDEVERLCHAILKMEARMGEQLKRLEHNDTQRRELLANVSHDLRTPLASVRGYLETLLVRQGTLDAAEQRTYLETATRQSERLGRLVDHLFELTKLDAREVELHREVFPPGELLQDVAQKFIPAAARKELHIDLSLAPDVPQVNADISLIERVLENLIENALRHCKAGGVVRLGMERSGDGVRVSVSDTGSGIAPQDLPLIFDRFFQSNRNSSVASGGAGLGLAITRRILDLHDSEVKVESTLGVGTTFSFVLAGAR